MSSRFDRMPADEIEEWRSQPVTLAMVADEHEERRRLCAQLITGASGTMALDELRGIARELRSIDRRIDRWKSKGDDSHE